MSDMKVNNLNVDLIQDQAVVSLIKSGQPVPGKATTTVVSINVPLVGLTDEHESALRKKALTQAKDALLEALRALEAQPA